MEIVFLSLTLSSSPLGTLMFCLDGTDLVLNEKIKTLFTGEYRNPNLPAKAIGYKGCSVEFIIKGAFATFSPIADFVEGPVRSFNAPSNGYGNSRITLRIKEDDCSLVICDSKYSPQQQQHQQPFPPKTIHIGSLKEDAQGASVRIVTSLLSQIPVTPAGPDGTIHPPRPRLEVEIEDCGEM